MRLLFRMSGTESSNGSSGPHGQCRKFGRPVCSSRRAGMHGIEQTNDLSNVTARCARCEKFGACVQSQPYGGSMCRFSESNMTMMHFMSRLRPPLADAVECHRDDDDAAGHDFL